MNHFALCIDRSDLFEQLHEASEAVLLAETGEVLEFSAGDSTIHFIIIDEKKEREDDDFDD